MSDTDNIDAIFDLATPAATPAPAETESNTANTPEDNEDTSSADKGGALYPNVLKTLTVSEAGEGNPEGTLTVAEFAAYLTVEAIKAGGGVESIVDKANIYTGTKAVRHPLPVVLVFPDDADQSDLSNGKVYLPVAEATEAWRNRPARGEGGNTATSKRTQDELLTDAAKRALSLAKIETRLKRVQAQHDKAVKLLEKSHNWLSGYYKADPTTLSEGTTQEEANKALLNKAIEERAAQLEEEEAAKSAAESTDIPDTDESQNA